MQISSVSVMEEILTFQGRFLNTEPFLIVLESLINVSYLLTKPGGAMKQF